MSYGQCNRPVKPPVDMEWCQEDTRQSSRQTSSGRFWGQQTNRKHEESFGSTIYSQGISFKWSFFPAPIFFRLSYLKVHINNSKIPYFLVLANSKYGVSMLLVNCLQFQVEWTSYIRNVFSLAFLSLLWRISCRCWLLDCPRSSLFSSHTWY